MPSDWSHMPLSLRVAVGGCFDWCLPCRLLVEDSRKVEVLEPLDVAVEEMSKKVTQLQGLVHASSPDMKLLQMQLQGALSLQVGNSNTPF